MATSSVRAEKNLLGFMKLAYFSASRCTDQNMKAGAVIIRDDRQLVSAGHFQYQVHVEDHHKELYECHAELNALLNTNDADVKGCTMYVTNYPCCDCVKLALQAGIAKIIHLEGPKTGADGKILQVHRATENITMRLPGRSDFCRSFRDELKAVSTLPPEITSSVAIVINDDADIDWEPLDEEHYFMGMAYLAAEQSDDINTKVGACIVSSEKRIVGLGYNAMPVGGQDVFSWTGKIENRGAADWIATKYPYVIHAAAMAILNKNASSLRGCTLYTTHYPDNDCAMMIIRSGITDVVYWKNEKKNEDKIKVAMRMLGDENHQVGSVTVRHFTIQYQVKFEVLGEKVDVFSQRLVTSAGQQVDHADRPQ